MSTPGSARKSAIGQLVNSGFDDDPRVAAFRAELVLHDRFQRSLDQIAERMQYGEQQSMTAVLGPTGSGKTALVSEFAFQFSTAMKSVPEASRTTLLCMELAAAEQGAFKWKDDFYIPALHALNEPCVTKKIDVESLRAQLISGNTKAPYAGHPKTVADFRNHFYAAMNRAKTIGALFDEANHLRRPGSKRGIFAQYDSLKSRSNACRAHFVLLGTIEIADIFRQSGPISKRVYPIWLSPYGLDDAERTLFGNAVLSIVEKLPEGIKIKFGIESNLDALYERSFGVYGVVHDWFDRALVRTLRLERSAITWRDMEELSLNPLQLSGIAADLIRYRDVMLGADTYLQEQKASLFLPFGPGRGSSSRDAVKSTSKPFERKPERDKVGE